MVLTNTAVAKGAFFDDSSEEEDTLVDDPDYFEDPQKHQSIDGSTPSVPPDYKSSVQGESSQLESDDIIFIKSSRPTVEKVSKNGPALHLKKKHKPRVVITKAKPAAAMAPVINASQSIVNPSSVRLKISGRPYKCASMAQKTASLMATVEWLVQERHKILETHSENKIEYLKLALEFEGMLEKRLLESGFERP